MGVVERHVMDREKAFSPGAARLTKFRGVRSIGYFFCLILTTLCLACCKGSTAPDSPEATVSSLVSSGTGSISLFAGGLGGSGSLEATGTAARFAEPAGLAMGSDGSLYVADFLNHTVMQVSPAGIVTTLAGKAGESGAADGNGPDARFKNPAGLTVASDGTVYVADSGNYTIRKITPGGAVSTLAGSAGLAGTTDETGSLSRFKGPAGITLAPDGMLYVTDSVSNTIRKLTPAGAVTTLAGLAGVAGSQDGTGTAARFSSPTGIAADAAGLLYVADAGNHVIRKVAPDGAVATWAGQVGVPGEANGSGTSARFHSPYGVGVDATGNVYVADHFNHVIRHITPAGAVTTLAGQGGIPGSADGSGSLAQFNNPSGIFVNGSGTVFVSDGGNSEIRKISAGVVSTFAGLASHSGAADATGALARFNGPAGVAIKSDGTVFVADTLNQVVRQVTPAGDATTVAGSAGNSGTIDGTGSGARFSNPEDVAVDISGNIYVTDSRNHVIRKISVAGAVTTFAGLTGSSGSSNGAGGAARFSSPGGIAIDGFGVLYVVDSGNYTIRKITPAGVVTTLAGLSGSRGSNNGTGAAARFHSPYGIALANDGTVYVSEIGNHVIRTITPAGVVTTLAGTAGTAGAQDGQGNAARFRFPSGIDVDSDGNVYVADTGNHSLRKITPTGDVTTLAGSANSVGVLLGDLPGSLSAPLGLAIGVEGALYVTDENSVLKVTLPTPISSSRVSLQAASTAISLGQSISLTWSTFNAFGCTASGDWSGSRSATGTMSVTPASVGTYSYTLTCSDMATTSTQSATVEVVVSYPTPTVNLSASSSIVVPGQSLTLSWSAANVSTCEAGGSWTGTQPTSGSLTFTPLAGLYDYSLTCTGLGGSASRSVSVAVANPPTVLLSATKTSILVGRETTLSWSSTGANTCVASGAWSGPLATTAGSTTITSSVAGIYSYTVTCTGPGGPKTASLNIKVKEPAASGSAGSSSSGGAAGWEILTGLIALGLRQRRSISRRRGIGGI